MSHEIDLKKYNLHTDIALEEINGESGYSKESKNYNDCLITKVIINKDKVFNKRMGTYLTIEFEDITDIENRKKVIEVLKKELTLFLNESGIKEKDSCLIVGLGNASSTPDALGPKVSENILVTSHLFLYGNPLENYRKVSAITPNVTGITGIETSSIIKGVVNEIKPDFIIVIDALSSHSIERVGKTIQISNTGIGPGSGVGNKRKEISKELLGIPVIAIGIPTVVDAVTIVTDTIDFLYKKFFYTKENISKPSFKLVPQKINNYLKHEVKIEKEEKEKIFGLVGTLEKEETKELIEEVLTPIGYNLMVTPKEIDFLIDNLTLVLKEGINSSLHNNI